MKLIIQIPCYNEAGTLAVALAQLPRKVDGFSQVEWLIINDGSADNTVEVARANGVDHVVSFPHNMGLAKAFLAGLDACLELGADVIVNTDADNQYNAADIPLLTAPILEGKADFVIGARPIMHTSHFSTTKKLLQRLGSWAVRVASRTNIADAPSGFRAISKEAALRLNVFNRYTYTLETIIQSGQKGLAVCSVPIRTNTDLRPSRLVKSIRQYVQRSILTILRIFIIYRPAVFMLWLGLVPFTLGALLYIRWVVLFLMDYDQGGTLRSRAPSLIIATVLIVTAFLSWLFGFVAELMATNRKLLEDIQYRIRRMNVTPGSSVTTSHHVGRTELKPPNE